MTTQSSSSQKFIEEFYGFPKRPSVTDTIPLTKPIVISIKIENINPRVHKGFVGLECIRLI